MPPDEPKYFKTIKLEKDLKRSKKDSNLHVMCNL
jgi:hypothetical protein